MQPPLRGRSGPAFDVPGATFRVRSGMRGEGLVGVGILAAGVVPGSDHREPTTATSSQLSPTGRVEAMGRGTERRRAPSAERWMLCEVPTAPWPTAVSTRGWWRRKNLLRLYKLLGARGCRVGCNDIAPPTKPEPHICISILAVASKRCRRFLRVTSARYARCGIYRRLKRVHLGDQRGRCCSSLFANTARRTVKRLVHSS